ncbi:MAG: GntR family transcriptional regulator [Actinomycetota bacterium]
MPAQPLDRTSPMPLWAQLESELRRRLDAGDFHDGVFPTDLELTESYGVSRHTVREAVRRLNSSGLLTRERGRGTVINRSEFEQSLGTLYSLFQSVEAAGVDQTSEVLQFEVTTDADAAKQMEVDIDTPLVLLARLRMAGGEPLAIDRAWLPESVAAPLDGVDWSHTALYTELANAGLPVPNEGWERLTPVVPSPADCDQLDLAAGDAAFYLERLGRRDGQPVEWRTTLIRGDRFRFVSDWSAGSQASLRPAPTSDP